MIYAVLARATSVGSEEEVHRLMEVAFDEVEDAHSGVKKDPQAFATNQSDGRMYPPHPDFRLPNLEPSTYRHRLGNRTVIGKNGSFRVLKIGADLSETVAFEKRGKDGRGYWED